ncbi:hypothetical protein N7462_007724 [Penicillium macrosclerotiorum]|uniref:uncharacterized protein n=1 Tax=Penicillium macrosclerotiorum TaxID=303699 RepID=UPI00254699DD|nr:uncharacterized protein N7462_007724 [Penicillium macrosclerotiorum]KAJ5679480.1 hypothetical protein N7462_007724 [Penicillium macrosclerotiorum]
MSAPLTNYVTYLDPELHVPRVGHLKWDDETIQPLAFFSGAPLESLYQIIVAGHHSTKPIGDPIALHSVQLRPPFAGRDILAVGKNYAEHAIEFNKSGYDNSDKADQPSHPVFFTKRATSIVAHGAPIVHHPSFTKTLDYEGEIGVIIGKGGLGIKKENALDHVWGYTIINDVTARERQRDHKQFFIGKSGDSFCPMGPVAVPAHDLPGILQVQTFVNGQERQRATTKDFIFSIPTLIETLSVGITLQPGDVIATGTPAGVGFSQDPPVWLQPGDEVKVSVTGLGSLINTVCKPSPYDSLAPIPDHLNIADNNLSKTITGECLTVINGKRLFYKKQGTGNKPIVFIHGLGSSSEFFTPLINALDLNTSHRLYLIDLEGHGLSPTSPLSNITIESLANDLNGIFEKEDLSFASQVTVVAHSMGCLVALDFAIKHPEKAKKIVLLGPPPNPLTALAVDTFTKRASLVRRKGMLAVADTVATAGTSQRTKVSLGFTTVRLSLLGTEPESYAKACTALAECKALPIQCIQAKTLIVTGNEDKVSPPALCASYAERIPHSLPPVVLDKVGHWHIFEDFHGVANAISDFL